MNYFLYSYVLLTKLCTKIWHLFFFSFIRSICLFTTISPHSNGLMIPIWCCVCALKSKFVGIEYLQKKKEKEKLQMMWHFVVNYVVKCVAMFAQIELPEWRKRPSAGNMKSRKIVAIRKQGEKSFIKPIFEFNFYSRKRNEKINSATDRENRTSKRKRTRQMSQLKMIEWISFSSHRSWSWS